MRDTNKIKRMRALQVKKQKRQLLMIATLVILVLCVISMSFLSNAKELTDKNDTFHYESILIKDGDSLWSIVNEYNLDNDVTIEHAIDNLMYLNNMNDTIIYEGQYLVIGCKEY